MSKNLIIKAAVVLSLAALAVLAALQVWSRPVDRDEGFWLYTSWRLAAGDVPYRDFALPHLPLASWYYAGAVKLAGPSLYGLRAANVALFLAGGALLGLASRRRFGGAAAAFTLLLYGSSSLALTWLVPVKAYAPATFALAAAVALWLWADPARGVGAVRAAAVGFLLGVGTLARLPLAATLAAGAVAAWAAVPPGARFGRRLARVAAVCAGFLLAVSPAALYYHAAAREAFAFNVVGIHRMFMEVPAAGRGRALLDLFLPPDPVVLVVLAAAAVTRERLRALAFPLLAGLFVLLANVVPGSSQLQYFVPMVAAFAPAAGAGAARLWAKRRLLAVAVVAATALVGAARPAAKVALNRAHKEKVGPAEVYAAAALLRANTRPGDTIYTGWPGYAALAERRVLAGWEMGYFTHRIGTRLDAASRRRYKLMTYDETAAALARGDAAYALDGLDTPETLRPALARSFEPVARYDGVTLLRYRGRR